MQGNRRPKLLPQPVDLLEEGFPEHLSPLPATDGGSSPLPRHWDSLGIRLALRSSLVGGETRAGTSLPGMQLKHPPKHPPAAGAGHRTRDHSDSLPLGKECFPEPRLCKAPGYVSVYLALGQGRSRPPGFLSLLQTTWHALRWGLFESGCRWVPEKKKGSLSTQDGEGRDICGPQGGK